MFNKRSTKKASSYSVTSASMAFKTIVYEIFSKRNLHETDIYFGKKSRNMNSVVLYGLITKRMKLNYI